MEATKVVNWKDIAIGLMGGKIEGFYIHTDEVVEVIPGEIAVLSIGIVDERTDRGEQRLVLVFLRMKGK